MILTCTNCKTSFVASDTSIGPSGRKVKCSKCQYVWFATLPAKPKIELSSILPDGQTLQGSFNLPAISDIRIAWYLYILPLIMGSIFITSYGVLFPNKILALNFIDQKMLCQKFDICDTSGIKLKDVKFQNMNKGDKKFTVLSYKVANNTDYPKNIPIIKVRLLDKEKNVIKSHIASNKNIPLKPFHQHLIETRFEDLPANVENIELIIGNRLELVLR
ncbi:MAG: hypothetical protein K0R02_454 [Rickettsiaceae bacterium]|jgi:predicted Zn finger-like uncharacterized protein|nr:hypothetical protein [Rickettsiaceae bacterium]